MSNFFKDNDILDRDQIVFEPSADVARAFMSKLFTYMFIGLAISAGVSYWFAVSGNAVEWFFKPDGGVSMLYWVVAFAPIGMILLMGKAYRTWNFQTLAIFFAVFCTLMGLSLSTIFLAYDGGAIFRTFLIAGGMFGAMAVAGYTTKTDLTKMGNLLYMALIGLIIASVVNWIWPSGTMSYIISIVGVLIFTGLTAYDTQRYKKLGAQIEAGTEEANKLALMGATSLYLDFINLFLFLLRLFGGRD